MLKELKKLLSECHPKSDDVLIKSWMGNTVEYLTQRAKEEMDTQGPGQAERLKRVIQLLTIARFKILKADASDGRDVNSAFGGRNVVGVKGGRQLSNRELVYRYCELPHNTQLDVAAHLGLWSFGRDEELNDTKRIAMIIERATAHDVLIAFEHEVTNAHKELYKERYEPVSGEAGQGAGSNDSR